MFSTQKIEKRSGYSRSELIVRNPVVFKMLGYIKSPMIKFIGLFCFYKMLQFVAKACFKITLLCVVIGGRNLRPPQNLIKWQ